MVSRRPDIIKMHPEVPSKVVHTHHAGVWAGDTLSPEAIRQMLDASITALTGLNDAAEAWAALFDPNERIAIKVNAIRTSEFWTHVPLVMIVTEQLQAVGVPPEQIIIFDRYSYELEGAGYTVNKDSSGVRCYGTDDKYAEEWSIVDTDIQFSSILLECDALINMPLLKEHLLSGISFAMKNHYGTFDRPDAFHFGKKIKQGIAQLNSLAPIKARTRLIIGDALNIAHATLTGWYEAEPGASIFMSFDPVAHDTAGLQYFSEVWTTIERDPASALRKSKSWLENGAKLGVGTNDPDSIDLVEVNLG
jgi:hypothetical protein